jgi:hypothetical protein
VLVVSNITMLRDFGFVTIIDMSVSLAGVLAVLPATLLASEHDDFAEWLRRVAERLGDRRLPTVLRRRATAA